MLKIVADSHIPFLHGILEPFAKVEYIKGTCIMPYNIKDADVLIIRTRTRCDRELLEGSKVKLICTATIGFDHIDTAYCNTHNISIKRAAGSNAFGVVQYVIAAMLYLNVEPKNTTLGIVGLGNVGGALDVIARNLGFKTICCDPPRALNEPDKKFYSLQQVAQKSDIISFHVPKEPSTIGMADGQFFNLCKEGVAFINSSRGEIVDDTALIEALESHKIKDAVLDVWNSEPNINLRLSGLATIATPHIAGYSVQGKAAATAMVVEAVAEYYNICELKNWWPDSVEKVCHNKIISWPEIKHQMPLHYNIDRDSCQLKQNIESFENLRNNYTYRNEFF